MISAQQEIFEASKQSPILVQFYATWCGPCQTLKPILADLEKNADGHWRLASVNVEEHPDFASKFNIKSIPAVLLFYNEEVIARFVGSKPKHIVQNWLDNNLPAHAYSGAYGNVDRALRQGHIDAAKSELLDIAFKENENSAWLTLLKALNDIGKNNNQARSFIERLDRSGPLGPIIKKVRDLIDVNEDEHSVRTPSSNPYDAKVRNVHQQLDIHNINFDLLNTLVHNGINEVREKNGVPPLEPHPILYAAALDHNNFQIKFDQLTHYQDAAHKATVKDRIHAFGGRQFRAMAENVQYKGFPSREFRGRREVLTNSYRESAVELVNNWVASPGHYQNLINPTYTHVGTAVGWNPENASLFATQVFGA